LQELVDDELVARERKAIDAHLSNCPTCTREYKELAHFTTGVAQAVHPIRPSAELSSKVLTVYHESREQIKAAPSGGIAQRHPVPVWWWWTAIGILVVAGLVILLWPGGPKTLGRVNDGTEGVRVLTHGPSGWAPAGRASLRSGDRVEVARSGTPCTLRFGAWGETLLHAPCAVQIERAGETLILRLLQQAPGRIEFHTTPVPVAKARRLRVAWGSAWVEVNAGEANDVTVEPLKVESGGWTGQLKASVQGGAARLGNTGDPQTVGEGFSRIVPQSGPCDAAQKID